MNAGKSGARAVIESLEGRRFLSASPVLTILTDSVVARPALAVRINKGYKGTATINRNVYPASVLITNESRTLHLSAEIEIINSKGKLKTYPTVGRLVGRKVAFTLIGTNPLIAFKLVFSANGKLLTGTVTEGPVSGTMSLKLV